MIGRDGAHTVGSALLDYLLATCRTTAAAHSTWLLRTRDDRAGRAGVMSGQRAVASGLPVPEGVYCRGILRSVWWWVSGGCLQESCVRNGQEMGWLRSMVLRNAP